MGYSCISLVVVTIGSLITLLVISLLTYVDDDDDMN